MNRPFIRRHAGLTSLLVLALLVAGFAGFVGCNRDHGDRHGHAAIVATTTILGDVTGELLKGTGLRVQTLMQPGVDPHLYELRTSDARQLEAADLVIYNGLGLEGKMGQAIGRLGDRAIEAGAMVPADRRISAEEFEGAHDPHIWMDVGLFGEFVVEGLADELADRFPEHAERIRANAEDYLGRVARLDSYARQAIELIPADQRILVTAHDAFGYFGQAYGIEVHGVQGLSTAQQASARDIENLVELIVSRRVPAVFIETSVNDRNVRKLVEGAQQRGHRVEIAPAIFSDSTGPAGTFEGTWLGMLDHNITLIAQHLGAPAIDIHGHFGRLTLGHDHDHHHPQDAPADAPDDHDHDDHDH